MALHSSSVLSVVPAVGLPSRRSGSEFLPVSAAAPCHNAVVFAGQRDVHYTLLCTKRVPSSAAVKAVAGSSVAPTEEGGEEDFELVRKFKNKVKTSQVHAELEPNKDMPGLRESVAFRSCVEKSFDLWVTVANRLRPSPGSKLYEGLHDCGEAFSAGLIRKEELSWKCMCDVEEGLELLRRLVSSALQKPLPCTGPSEAELPIQYNSESERCLSLILHRTCTRVHKDIEAMLD